MRFNETLTEAQSLISQATAKVKEVEAAAADLTEDEAIAVHHSILGLFQELEALAAAVENTNEASEVHISDESLDLILKGLK